MRTNTRAFTIAAGLAIAATTSTAASQTAAPPSSDLTFEVEIPPAPAQPNRTRSNSRVVPVQPSQPTLQARTNASPAVAPQPTPETANAQMNPASINALRRQTLGEIRSQYETQLIRKTSNAIGFYQTIKGSAAFLRTMDAIRFACAQPRLGCSVREMTAVVYLESNLGTLGNTHQGDAAGMGQVREVTAANLARIYNLNRIHPFEGKSPEWFAANRANPYVNALLTCAQIHENRVLLDARGLGITPANLYTFHNMGSEVGTDVIRAIRNLSRLQGAEWYALSQQNAFDLVPQSSATGNPGYFMNGGSPASITQIAARYSSSSVAADRLGATIERDNASIPAPTLSFVNGQLVSSYDNVILEKEAAERAAQQPPKVAKSPRKQKENAVDFDSITNRAFLVGGSAGGVIGLGMLGAYLLNRRRKKKAGLLKNAADVTSGDSGPDSKPERKAVKLPDYIPHG